jgi:hypothetical protein
MTMPTRTDDPMMVLVRLTASRLLLPGAVPASLQGSTLRQANERRSKLLHEIAGPFIDGEVRPVHARAADPYALDPQIPEVARQLQQIAPESTVARLTRRHMPDVPDLLTRIAIAMRLWRDIWTHPKSLTPSAQGTNVTTVTLAYAISRLLKAEPMAIRSRRRA